MPLQFAVEAKMKNLDSRKEEIFNEIVKSQEVALNPFAALVVCVCYVVGFALAALGILAMEPFAIVGFVLVFMGNSIASNITGHDKRRLAAEVAASNIALLEARTEEENQKRKNKAKPEETSSTNDETTSSISEKIPATSAQLDYANRAKKRNKPMATPSKGRAKVTALPSRVEPKVTLPEEASQPPLPEVVYFEERQQNLPIH